MARSSTRFGDYIKQETLSVSLEAGGNGDGHDWSGQIEGEAVSIRVARAGRSAALMSWSWIFGRRRPDAGQPVLAPDADLRGDGAAGDRASTAGPSTWRPSKLLDSGLRSVPFFGEYIRLTYVENRGAAFGVLQDQTASSSWSGWS